MKSRDLGFFTRHVEKIVLAAGLLVLGVILLLYVLGEPYAIELRNEKLDVAEIEKQIETTATQLQANIRTYDQFPSVEVYPYAVNFSARVDEDVSPITQLPGSVGRLSLGADIGESPEPPMPYDLPRPPLPENVVAYDSYSVYDASADEPEVRSQIVQMIGDRTPADFPFVSIQADFDLDAWLARLEDPSTANPVPRAFYRGKQGITAVYLQRQELDPVTGDWSEPVIVPTLPTQLAFTPDYTRNYTDTEAIWIVEQIKGSQEAIARPPFISLASHARQWLPPERAGNLTPDDHRKLDSLNRKIANLEKRITTIQDQMQRLRQQQSSQRSAPQRTAAQRPTRTATPGYDDAFDDYGMGGMGGVPGAASRTATPRANVTRTSRDQELQEQLQRSMTDLQEARQQRDELLGVELDATQQGRRPFMPTRPGMMPGGGVDPMFDPYGGIGMMDMYDPYGGDPYGDPYAMYGDPYAQMPPYGRGAQPNVRGRAGATGRQPGQPAEPEPVNRVIQVWAHDLTVERGKTYRYRILVSVLNPLFREARVEENQRAENFNKISLGPGEQELAAAPWTDPIVVEPEYEFFFVSGTAQQQYATVEVWRYFDGRPRKENFNVQPGDPIGHPVPIDGTTIDMSVGAVLVDLVGQSSRSGLGSSTRMLYIEDGQPQIKSRSLEQDRDSNARLRLENERKIIEALTGSLATAASAAP